AKDEALAVPSSSAEHLMTPVTQTGAVLGTPAYMSPEQFAGAPVDARADQFAYCVTAWEALWKQRPFDGASFAQLKAAISRGARRAPPASPRVPGRVRLALERGLAVDSTARFPTIHALLDAMRPAVRGRRRKLVAAAGAVAAVAAGVAAWLALRAPAVPSCDGAGAAELAAMRSDLPALLRQRGAAKIAVQADAVQWRYTARFRDNAERACEAGHLHEWSPEVIAQSQACFAITGRTAALLLAGADPGKPIDALRRLRRLPADDQCRNQNHLASRPPIPRDPAQLDALTEAKATLAVGFDSADDHDFVQLKQAIAVLEASPAHKDPGIAAGLIVLRAWRAYDDGHAALARKLFVDAYYAGRAIDDDQISSVALMQLIGSAPQLGLEPAAVKEWLRTALADADRIRARSPWLAGEVYVTAAQAADSGEDPESALVFVARARAVLEPGTRGWIETLSIEGASKIGSGHIEDGITAYESAIAQDIAELGPDDPEVASLLGNYASSLLDVQHLDAALDSAERAMQIIHNLADPNDDRIDPIRVNLAAVLISANRKEEQALALLRTARAHYVQRFGATTPLVANIDSNLATIYNDRGDYDQAIAALESALAIDEKLLGSDHADVGAVRFNLAAAYRFRGDYDRAIANALRAAEIFGSKSPGSDRHRGALTMAANAANDAGDFARGLELSARALDFPRPAEGIQTTAWSKVEHGRALIGLHRPEQARPFLIEARAGYSQIVMPQRVQQCEALLAKLPALKQ
ncbi:MAG TPA: tetratricopeptide repeat-containing protein kinase family protein, partial [Kofleriaceae bacterium]|nr:tetratricopeptide repeat-containing protein kinase family protein [Kofleriaceae bacterium]